MSKAADVYAFGVTDEERAGALSRRDTDDCACKVVMEKPGRGVAPRPILNMCDRHNAEHMERHTRAFSDYRAAQAAKENT